MCIISIKIPLLFTSTPLLYNGAHIFKFICMNIHFLVNPCWSCSLEVIWHITPKSCLISWYIISVSHLKSIQGDLQSASLCYSDVFNQNVLANMHEICSETLIHWNRVKAFEAYINVLHAKMSSWSYYKVLPLRLSCTITTVHSVTKENKNEIVQTKSFLLGNVSWLNRSMHNGILTTASVTLQNIFFQ